MLIKNGKVLLFEEGGFVERDIRVEGSIIKEISVNLQSTEGEVCYDAEGRYVTPGLIDAHSLFVSVKKVWERLEMTVVTILML